MELGVEEMESEAGREIFKRLEIFSFFTFDPFACFWKECLELKKPKKIAG